MTKQQDNLQNNRSKRILAGVIVGGALGMAAATYLGHRDHMQYTIRPEGNTPDIVNTPTGTIDSLIVRKDTACGCDDPNTILYNGGTVGKVVVDYKK